LRKLVFLSLILGSSCVFAQSSAVSAPASSSDSSDSASSDVLSGSTSGLTEKIKQKKFEEDERINDLQIRADAGSLSRYSMKFVVGYAGPEISNLASPNIPNPDNRSSDIRSNVSGIIGVKYRLTSNDGLYFSAGLKEYIRAQSGDNQDLTNPAISYDHTYLFSKAVQAHTTVMATMVTNSFYRPQGETWGMTVSQMVKWNIGTSRWVVGGSIDASNYFYNRGYDARTDGKKLADYSFNIIPSLEYKLTSNLNVNTSYSKSIAHYRKTDDPGTFDGTPIWNGRIGVGWAVKHDIYVNPYMTYYPEAMSWKYTSLGLSSTVSVF